MGDSDPSPGVEWLRRHSLGSQGCSAAPWETSPVRFPWVSSLTEPGAGFSPRFCSRAAEVICPPAFSFFARPAQPHAEGAERRGGLVPGIRGAQEVKPQPAAGTSRLRGGIIRSCQPLCPWAGGRHACCLAGSKEEQWIPLSLLIPGMFVTHVSSINPSLSAVLCSGDSHRKLLMRPVIVSGSPWC